MKTYTYKGKAYDKLPDPCDGCSPMTDERFGAMGGTITDDGQPTPKEAVIASLNALLHELAGQVEGITPAEFKQAARTMHSGELAAYARAKGVGEEIIAAARARIIEIMADALREGVSWVELINGIEFGNNAL